MPVQVDWTPREPDIPNGVHLLEVSKAVEKRSQKGDSMLAVTFRVVEGRARGKELDDYFMLAGKARHIGHEKLAALGFARETPFEAHELIGKRAYASIVQESREYQGKTYENARIDIKAEDSMCGLWPESNPPEGLDSNEPLANAIDEKPLSDDDSDVPF